MSHREIVIGLDDSRSARSALRWAAELCAPHGFGAARGPCIELAVGGDCPRI